VSELVPFVALEFSSALGPPPGRYLVRSYDDAPAAAALTARVKRATGVSAETGAADVLQMTVVGGPPPSGGVVFRRARKADAAAQPREVSLLVAMLIGATNRFADRRAAVGFLEACRADEDQQAELVEQTVDVVNLAVRAYRAAARDPFLAEITPADAREIRIGFGDAKEIVKGGWTEAFVPAPPRTRRLSREERLRPTEVVSLALSGRLPLLAAEEMALRTMLDLESGRPRAAAVQLRACVDLLIAELGDAGEPFAPPRDDLARRVDAVQRLASLGLGGDLDEQAVEELREHLDRVEDALEDWRAWHDAS